MPETQKDDYDFIKEKIKNKPLNKRRIALQVTKTVGLAAVFGFVACLVFVLMQPVMQGWFTKEESPVVSIPSDEQIVMETETERKTKREDEEEPAEDTEPETQIIQVPRDMNLDDYQRIQNKLYAVGAEANPSIVTVTGVKSDTDWFNTPYEQEGQASGIIIADNGNDLLIMTEKKVIKDAESISVTFEDGTVTDAQLRQYDGNTGIAILSVSHVQIDSATLAKVKVAELGNSLGVSQGNVVIAAGSPLGSNFSILTGNITSTDNSVTTIDHNFTVFTTDIVASSEGSGVLLNLDGQIIGLVMQDYSSSGDENTLTAISISDLKQIIEKLSNNQNISYLGIHMTEVTSEIEKKYGLPGGIYIKAVEMDSPAQAAGLQNGDIITDIDDTKMQTAKQYEQYIQSLTPGTEIKITIMRQENDGYTPLECQAVTGVLQ